MASTVSKLPVDTNPSKTQDAENSSPFAPSVTLPLIVNNRSAHSFKTGKSATKSKKLAVSHGVRTKSLGLTQTGIDLTFDQHAIHQIYNECIPWAAKRGGFKDLDSLRIRPTDADLIAGKQISQGDSEEPHEHAASKSKKINVPATRRVETRLLEYGGMRTELQNDLMLLICGQWSKTKDQQNVKEKLRAAGVTDTKQLKELICTRSLAGHGLPKATWFRGFPCELNRRVKDKGGSMFTTATLEHLLSSIEFKELVARKNQETIKRATSSEDDGEARDSRQWMHSQQTFSKKQMTLAAPSRRPLYMNTMNNSRKFNEKAWAASDVKTPEEPFATLQLKAPMSHTDITYIAISADSSLVAACGCDGNVALVYALEHVYTLSMHKKAVRHCSFNCDKTLLASASEDCTVCVWELSMEASSPTGKCVRVLSHDSLVRCCCFHPTEQILCTAGDDLAACLWYIPCWKESNTGKQVLLHGNSKVVMEQWNFPGSSCTQVRCMYHQTSRASYGLQIVSASLHFHVAQFIFSTCQVFTEKRGCAQHHEYVMT
jgi:hypothetical protein